MPKTKATSKNFKTVLHSIAVHFDAEPKEGKKVWVDAVNSMLDELRDDDFFGTEGQADPRGDNRD